MCDEFTVQDNEEYLKNAEGLTRREFGALAAGVGLSIVLPRAANALAVVESDVEISTPDGTADCYFVHPSEGRHPGVIVWPDILGLRPAFRMMGKRLAESGYSVLVVNPFYRGAKAPIIEEGQSFQDPKVREKIGPLYRQLGPDTHATDAKAFVSWIDLQSPVDTSRKIGTTGYCMGGPIVMRTAATVPERVGGAATFHGGGLVTDDENSPHQLIPKMKASFLIAIAANDDERQPDAKTVLKESYDKAGLAAEIEVYAGAMHGWCPPDSRVYNEAQAEKAWGRLLELFGKALA